MHSIFVSLCYAKKARYQCKYIKRYTDCNQH